MCVISKIFKFMDNPHTIHIIYLFAKIWKVNYYSSLKSRNSLLNTNLYMYLSTFFTFFCSKNALFPSRFFKIYYVQVRTAPAYQTKPINLVPTFSPLKKCLCVLSLVIVSQQYVFFYFLVLFQDIMVRFFFFSILEYYYCAHRAQQLKTTSVNLLSPPALHFFVHF